jgi:hypothetical protein
MDDALHRTMALSIARGFLTSHRCLQGAHIAALATNALDAADGDLSCIDSTAIDAFVPAAPNWTKASVTKPARGAAVDNRAERLPLDIDLDSLSLAWAVFGSNWDTNRVARDGICVWARNTKGCELGEKRTERVKAIRTALSMDMLTEDPEKLSQFATSVLLPGLVPCKWKPQLLWLGLQLCWHCLERMAALKTQPHLRQHRERQLPL